jgi:uncharacterized membrane protein
MPPAFVAATVNTSQSNIKLKNGITAFTVTSFLLFSCVTFGVLCAAGTKCNAAPWECYGFARCAGQRKCAVAATRLIHPQRTDLRW